MGDFLHFLQLTLGENPSPALSSATLLGEEMKDFLRFLQLTLGENPSPALSSATLLGEEMKDFLRFLQLTLGENPSPALSPATLLWRRGEGLSPLFTADNRKNPYPSHKQRCHFIFHQIASMYYEDFLVSIVMKTTFLVNEAQPEYLALLYNLVLVSTRRNQIIH